MRREIIVEISSGGQHYVVRDGVRVSCAFDLEQDCVATCAAFEKSVGTKRACMCNRGQFEIGQEK